MPVCVCVVFASLADILFALCFFKRSEETWNVSLREDRACVVFGNGGTLRFLIVSNGCYGLSSRAIPNRKTTRLGLVVLDEPPGPQTRDICMIRSPPSTGMT